VIREHSKARGIDRLQRDYWEAKRMSYVIAAAASFFVKDHLNIDPKIAAGILLGAAWWGKGLLGKKPGRLADLGRYSCWPSWAARQLVCLQQRRGSIHRWSRTDDDR
jgi:hypothetical protein